MVLKDDLYINYKGGSKNSEIRILKSEILEPPFIQSLDAIFTQKARYRDADVKK